MRLFSANNSRRFRGSDLFFTAHLFAGVFGVDGWTLQIGDCRRHSEIRYESPLKFALHLG